MKILTKEEMSWGYYDGMSREFNGFRNNVVYRPDPRRIIYPHYCSCDDLDIPLHIINSPSEIINSIFAGIMADLGFVNLGLWGVGG